MQSSFDTARIFNDQDGWYIVMRESDEKYLTSSKHKVIADQHLMGPFNNKQQVEMWFDGYVSMHGSNRNTDAYIPDSAAGLH